MDIVGFTRDLTSNNVSKVTEKPVYFKRKPTLYLTSHPSYTGYKDYYNLLEPWNPTKQKKDFPVTGRSLLHISVVTFNNWQIGCDSG